MRKFPVNITFLWPFTVGHLKLVMDTIFKNRKEEEMNL